MFGFHPISVMVPLELLNIWAKMFTLSLSSGVGVKDELNNKRLIDSETDG